MVGTHLISLLKCFFHEFEREMLVDTLTWISQWQRIFAA